MGGTEVYSCDRCPLILEFGQHIDGDNGVIRFHRVQVACAACGTMHRLTEQEGVCYVTALRGPVRKIGTVTLRDVSGEEVDSPEWAAASDWMPVGEHPGGIADMARLACSHCAHVGRMLNWNGLVYPDGYVPNAPRRAHCPICGDPLHCIAVTDSI